MVSNKIAYLKNNLMKVLACMKEDEADFIKYSRIESEKNVIVTLSQPSPKSLSIENTSNMLFKSEVIQSSICIDDTWHDHIGTALYFHHPLRCSIDIYGYYKSWT